jgi:serine/threonine protein kinase
MLHLSEGDIFANNYRLVRLIDTGGFADVWEAVFLNAGNTVALKIYPKLDAEGIKNIEMEYTNQSELSHSNLLIARYFGFHEGYPFLEMRYCPGGNATTRIGQVNEEEMALCIFHIASALEYLHSDDRVHQDLKPNNFLIDNKGKYYLADLGLSLKLRTTIQRHTVSKSATNVAAGTTPPCYRAPELCDRSSIGAQPIKATDVWALGASLFELATAELPFGDFGGCTQLNNAAPPHLPRQFSAELNYIIRKCLSKNTWERPKASELETWGHNYITSGQYGFKAEEMNKENITNTDPLPVDENSHVIRPENKEPVRGKASASLFIKLAFGLLIVGLAVLAVWWVINNNKKESLKEAFDTTSPLYRTDSGKNAGTVKPPVAGTTKPPADKSDTVVVKKIPVKSKTTEVGDSPDNIPDVYIKPKAEIPPSSGMISISKIERSSENTIVYFMLKRPDNNNNSTFSIYGPEKPSSCFFIDANGKPYKLISIYPKGEGLTFGSSNTLTVKAVFERIPDNTDVISIVEGVDRDRMNQNYWSFLKVHLIK